LGEHEVALEQPENRYSLIMTMIQELRSKGSWCGETHLQKALYAFNVLSPEKFPYKFIIYKHGPFSFDLRDDLSFMRASNLIGQDFTKEGYGPSLNVTGFGSQYKNNNSSQLRPLSKVCTFIVDWLGRKDVKELERLSTALFISVTQKDTSAADRVAIIRSIKPHISEADAERAIVDVQIKLESARQLDFVDPSDVEPAILPSAATNAHRLAPVRSLRS
jgi:hypothetical protein